MQTLERTPLLRVVMVLTSTSTLPSPSSVGARLPSRSLGCLEAARDLPTSSCPGGMLKLLDVGFFVCPLVMTVFALIAVWKLLALATLGVGLPSRALPILAKDSSAMPFKMSPPSSSSSSCSARRPPAVRRGRFCPRLPGDKCIFALSISADDDRFRSLLSPAFENGLRALDEPELLPPDEDVGGTTSEEDFERCRMREAFCACNETGADEEVVKEGRCLFPAPTGLNEGLLPLDSVVSDMGRPELDVKVREGCEMVLRNFCVNRFSGTHRSAAIYTVMDTRTSRSWIVRSRAELTLLVLLSAHM